MDYGEKFRFTGFYGQTDPSLRQQSLDKLRRVKNMVNEGWIMGGDFNAILNNSEKEGGRRKPRTLMDDFCDVLEELSLTDVKTPNGWFTWSNNREGTRLVKRGWTDLSSLTSSWKKCRFLLLKLFASRNPIMRLSLWICIEEQEAKDIITRAWSSENCNVLEKMELIRDKLGPWQYQCFRRMKYKIKGLEKEISKLMDGPTNEGSLSLLKCARSKLGRLYDVEEKYWAFRARSKWLKEGDRNTPFFHIRASGRRKKNNIERLKDAHGAWHEDKEEIGHIAWNYFNDLFKTSINLDIDSDMHYVPVCIDGETNRRLIGEFTDEEILRAFKQMDSRKAPGIDGLSGSFFKDHWMEGCLAVDSKGKSGGLALMWRASVNDDVVLRFTGFYGQSDSSQRQQAWNMLRRVSDKVTEGWIVRGDFNAILNDSEKEGGREGDRLVKERLDRFVVSDATMEKLPFLTSFIVRQPKSDHEAIMMDSEGSRPNKAKAG
ncbi:hypothetical protein GOBAR_AA11933 [Gossypium barbadense]|uniref:Endonuclease/exonuclease/phosphatase domain-containing protein n=1 Tax=Gossypium barbadense TaxID=3634 RepID=A0A2P5XZD8_GOSBA|nr:hypothetical protein GOBAR_AA11933 [Gossypium barbadense]